MRLSSSETVNSTLEGGFREKTEGILESGIRSAEKRAEPRCN